MHGPSVLQPAGSEYVAYFADPEHALRFGDAYFSQPLKRDAGLCLLLAAALFILATMEGATAASSKQVMLLHSFGREFKPWSEYARTIREELNRQSPWPLDITEHTLVTARSSDENPETPFVEYLGALFADQPLDLVVSIGAPAAAFVQRHRQQLFANTPMVLTAVDERRVQFSSLTDNDAVVAVRIDYLKAIANILQVLPDTKHVAVVVGASPIEKFWREEIAKGVKSLASRVRFIWYNDLSFEDILKQAAKLPPDSAIFWELMSVDAAGVVHEGNVALARLHAVASAPIFSYDESFFGNEIVGGPLLSVSEGSRQAAAVAVRILGGEKAGDIKVPSLGFANPKFDWREMQRWGISESRLPPGSEILFREPTAWERYRWQMVLTAIVLLSQTALIAGLFYEHRRRRTAELEVRQRMSELAHVNRQATVGELSASMAHELNQPLGAILSNAEAAELLLESPSPDLVEVRKIVSDIRRNDQRASQIIQRLRGLLKKKTVASKSIDLNETVGEVLEFLTAQASANDIRLITAMAPQSLRVSGDRIQLQQAVLNLIVNGIEALAGTRNAERVITIRTALADNTSAEVSITDSGAGIPPEKLKDLFEPFFTTKENGMGMGLAIARKIIEAHGGHIWGENRSAGGAVFRLSLPLAPRPQ
jgi:signal transduction histidine kinase